MRHQQLLKRQQQPQKQSWQGQDAERPQRCNEANNIDCIGVRSKTSSYSLLVLMSLLAVVTNPVDAFWSNKDAKKEENVVQPPPEKTDYSKSSNGNVPDDTPVEYGVDVSFPIHHSKVSTNYPWLPHNMDPSIPTPRQYKNMVLNPLGDRQSEYDKFIKSCADAFGKQGHRCYSTEQDRFEMSLRQPQSMQNYTKVGFKKIRAPPALYKLIKEFWDNNKHRATPESWGVGNTYTNNWISKSDMVSVEDRSLRGGGNDLKQKIWDAARDVIGEWTGQDLTQCSLYGIRVYKDGAILAPHVDRLPLVSSAIINVDQDVDEPWPLEVYGHDGKATNVTMEPGDMVLYESHSVIHGRPYPMKGRYLANIFVHFEPTGHSLRHHASLDNLDLDQDVNTKYRESITKGHSGHENTEGNGLPPYILQGTPEDSHWRETHPGGYKSEKKTFTTGSTSAHAAAKEGDIATLEMEIKRKKEIVNVKDENGWTPLHEGVRGGHVDVVRLLVENGADVNATTYGNGGSALWWAKQTHEEDHPIIALLESIGAAEIGPEL